MKNILIIISLGCLISCKTVPEKNTYSVFPVEPEWIAYTRQPVIVAVEGPDGEEDFIVTDELVKKAIQQKNYIDKVKKWRTVNNVP